MVLNYPVKEPQRCHPLRIAPMETIRKKMGGRKKHCHKCCYFEDLKSNLSGSSPVQKCEFNFCDCSDLNSNLMALLLLCAFLITPVESTGNSMSFHFK